MKRENSFRKIIGVMIVSSVIALVGMNIIKTTAFYQGTDRTFFSFISMLKYGVIDYPVSTLTNAAHDISTAWSVRQENDILRQELEATSQWETLVEALKKEVEDLKSLNELKSTFTDYSLINAAIKERPDESWDQTIIVDVGREQGVSEGDGLIASQGILGRAVHVDENQSVVSLITANDQYSQVAVQIQIDGNNYIQGILTNYDPAQKLFTVQLLETTTNVIPGMKVSTSGLGGIYPSGFLVGEVDSVKSVADGAGSIIYIKSAVNFANLKYVAVVKRP